MLPSCRVALLTAQAITGSTRDAREQSTPESRCTEAWKPYGDVVIRRDAIAAKAKPMASHAHADLVRALCHGVG